MGSDSHTPGPWVFTDEREICGEFWIQSEHPEVGGVSLAAVRPGCAEAEELGSAKANARLIAASPCMKEALEEILLCPAILDELNGDSETNNAVAKARAALSRATKGGEDDH